MSLYVTKNRLENVESHGLNGRNCIAPFANDAMKEFLRDDTPEIIQIYNQLTKAEQKIIKGRLGLACKELVG